jgi:hypothetical protein
MAMSLQKKQLLTLGLRASVASPALNVDYFTVLKFVM